MKKHYYLLSLFLVYVHVAFGQSKMDRPTTFEDDFSFAWRQDKDSIKLIAINKLYAPLEIILSSRKTKKELNSILVKKLDSTVVLQYKSQVLDSLKNYVNENLKISYYIGHPSVISPDSTYLYRLPFKKEKKYEVSQGWKGKRTHKGITSQYALDFQLDVGEPVYAAREGIVVKVVDWFTKRGGPALRNAANRIVILHKDGTMASYVHLRPKGTFVKEGEKVKKGQKIGISGLTGYTSGPHLHFVVRKERDISIPIYFEGYEGRELKMGKRYKIK